MQVARRLIGVIAVLAFSVSIVVLGVGACLLPPVTHVLANAHAKDDISPFDRSQLVRVADATRDFSFGSHDESALYKVIYEVDAEYRKNVEEKGGKLENGFPALDLVSDPNDVGQLKAANVGASEMYCYSAETVSHLDDCYGLFRAAIPFAVACVIIALVTLVGSAFIGRRKWLGSLVRASGVVVLVVFIGMGAWAVIDFNGFFSTLHQLFFSQGNWQFPYDSLLICSLPTEFWMGMGIIWLVVSALASILSIIIGTKMSKGRT